MKLETAALFALGAAIALAAIWYSRAPRAHYVPVGYDGKTLADVYL